MTENFRAHLLLLAVVMVWGATFVLVKDALDDVSPLLFNLVRMALATLCLVAVYGRHLLHLSREDLVGGMVAGFFLGLGYEFQTAGLVLTTPSKSAFITGLTVVLVPLLSVVPALRAPGSVRPGWNAYAGALLAFVGITLLTAPGLLLGDLSSVNLGDMLTLGCALSFAFHLLSLSHLARRIRYERLALLQVGFSTLFMAICMPLFEHPHLRLTARLMAALVVGAVLATAAAFTIQSWAQQHLAASHTALILTGEPVFAWLTSLLVLHQGMSGRAAVGAVLILAGIVLTELLKPTVEPTAVGQLVDEAAVRSEAAR